MKAKRIFPGSLLGSLILLLFVHPSQAVEPPWHVGHLQPAWSENPTQNVLVHPYESNLSPMENGKRLAQAMQKLQPGETLKIESGTYEFGPKLTLNLRGTEKQPIRIVGANPESPPRLVRDERQNLMNLGEGNPCRYLIFKHLVFRGGSIGLRFHDVSHVWLDRCEISHCEHGGLTANTHHTSHLFITQNHLHSFPHGTGEGMYLGANHGKHVMRDSVVAGNHVHDCGGSQGDGIELKQGSFRNWIVGNQIHDTKYPCLTVYGTGNSEINLIERNTCYRSQDAAMQIQGDALIRNNLLIGGDGVGFRSTDHQGQTRNLQFVHNTIIARKTGAHLSSWNDRKDMVFANNAIYSQEGVAIRFPNGAKKVVLTGNVVFGGTDSRLPSMKQGNGLTDFRDLTWTGERRDARPVTRSVLIDAGNPLITNQYSTVKTRPEKINAGIVDFSKLRQ